MNFYTVSRRQSDHGPRWRLNDEGGKCVALVETQDGADALASQLNELKRLRVLLAVSAKSLSISQACAILGYGIRPEDITRMTGQCLAKGFK